MTINEAVVFSHLVPDADRATPCVDYISLPVVSHHICPSLWQSSVGVTLQLGPVPGSRYWAACMSPGTSLEPVQILSTQHFHA